MGITSKYELGLKYGYNPYYLGRLLNHEYFSELAPLGYKKTDKRLKPNVVRKFIELEGLPINEEDFTE